MLRRALPSPSASASDARDGSARAAIAAPLPTVAVLLLVQHRTRDLPWALSRLVLGEHAAGAAGSVPGLRFARALGSGRDGGFGLVPSLARQGLFAMFDDEAQARDYAFASPVVRRYRGSARESLVTLLRATSCRGSWSGMAMAATAPAAAGAPMAALTRASIRARHAASFWRHTPAAQGGVQRAPGCRLAVGLGEAPLLRQATVSLWDDVAAMDAYARGGAHRVAAQGAVRHDWFSESMFVRFAVLYIDGRWHGIDHG
jgi:heme-degrading monooxygenase HmoA